MAILLGVIYTSILFALSFYITVTEGIKANHVNQTLIGNQINQEKDLPKIYYHTFAEFIKKKDLC